MDDLRSSGGTSILEIGSGSGRNTQAMRSRGFEVMAVADDRIDLLATEVTGRAFDGALSSHGLLHGTRAGIDAVLQSTAAALRSAAPLYATFGSKSDVRYGAGKQIDAGVFVAESGEEAGVAHAFFDRAGLRALLERDFTIIELREESVDRVVGRWAHRSRPTGSVHWFVRARRKQRA